MANQVMKSNEILLWEAPDPHRRRFGLMFERDITPTKNLTAGIVILPPKQEQPKLSSHEAEEIYYVVRGRGLFELDGKLFEVESGTGVYVGRGVKHRAINVGDEELELFYVNSPPEGVFGPVGGYLELVKDWKRLQ
jgi:mannose-6-phosphate isomerase-like protein (cupin superfamily)